MDKKAPDKKQRLLSALEQGMVMLHLDARRPGVVVPEGFKTENHLRLNVSYRFDPPDLTVTEWGIRSTLSFSGSRFRVSVPWNALFAITSHVSKEFWLYPDDMPAELLQSLPAQAAAAPASRPPVASAAASEEPAAEAPPAEDPPADGPAPKPRGRRHLRVVK